VGSGVTTGEGDGRGDGDGEGGGDGDAVGAWAAGAGVLLLPGIISTTATTATAMNAAVMRHRAVRTCEIPIVLPTSLRSVLLSPPGKFEREGGVFTCYLF
jgi:hypothetical protein